MSTLHSEPVCRNDRMMHIVHAETGVIVGTVKRGELDDCLEYVLATTKPHYQWRDCATEFARAVKQWRFQNQRSTRISRAA